MLLEHSGPVAHHLSVSPQGPASPPAADGGGGVAVEEMAERLTQTELLVTQLKDMIREKDAALRTKDDQLKVGQVHIPYFPSVVNVASNNASVSLLQ